MVAAACLGAATLGAGNAQAGVVTIDAGTINVLPVDEFGGQTSQVIVEKVVTDGITDIQIFDSAGIGGPDPPGCIRVNFYSIRCPPRGTINVNLGLGADRFELSERLAPFGNEIKVFVGGAQGPDIMNIDSRNPRNALSALALAASVPMTTLNGGPGDDMLTGGPYADKLVGGPGNDRMFGGPGVDLFSGGPGRDFARGGGGNDRGSGGPGNDNFRD